MFDGTSELWRVRRSLKKHTLMDLVLFHAKAVSEWQMQVETKKDLALYLKTEKPQIRWRVNSHA